ncbi:MAG: GNAT family N-acetyltransferase [Pseudomonadota bacterium]
MIDISYHDSVKDVQAMFDANTGLRIGEMTPFDRPQWYDLLEQTGLNPIYAAASQGDDRAILSLMKEGSRIVPFRNWYAFTWQPLAQRNAAGDALIAKLAQDLKSRAHRVTLEPLANENGAADQVARAFAMAGWRVEVTQCDVNHVIHLGGKSFAEYWKERPGPLRTTLKRKGKKVTTKVIENFDPALWDQYEQIYGASWKPEEDHPKMLRAFAKAEGEEGRLRLGLAFYDEKPIAAQFWTVENDCAYIHKLAHLDEHNRLSAGTTLSAALFEHVIDQDRVKAVDFGTGDQPYKADWMGQTRPRYRVDCLNMKRPAAWVDLAKLAFHRLKDADVPMLAQRPWAG